MFSQVCIIASDDDEDEDGQTPSEVLPMGEVVYLPCYEPDEVEIIGYTKPVVCVSIESEDSDIEIISEVPKRKRNRNKRPYIVTDDVVVIEEDPLEGAGEFTFDKELKSKNNVPTEVVKRRKKDPITKSLSSKVNKNLMTVIEKKSQSDVQNRTKAKENKHFLSKPLKNKNTKEKQQDENKKVKINKKATGKKSGNITVKKTNLTPTLKRKCSSVTINKNTTNAKLATPICEATAEEPTKRPMLINGVGPIDLTIENVLKQVNTGSTKDTVNETGGKSAVKNMLNTVINNKKPTEGRGSDKHTSTSQQNESFLPLVIQKRYNELVVRPDNQNSKTVEPVLLNANFDINDVQIDIESLKINSHEVSKAFGARPCSQVETDCTPPVMKKRRGRPPGSKTRQYSVNGEKVQPRTKGPGRPPKSEKSAQSGTEPAVEQVKKKKRMPKFCKNNKMQDPTYQPSNNQQARSKSNSTLVPIELDRFLMQTSTPISSERSLPETTEKDENTKSPDTKTLNVTRLRALAEKIAEALSMKPSSDYGETGKSKQTSQKSFELQNESAQYGSEPSSLSESQLGMTQIKQERIETSEHTDYFFGPKPSLSKLHRSYEANLKNYLGNFEQPDPFKKGKGSIPSTVQTTHFVTHSLFDKIEEENTSINKIKIEKYAVPLAAFNDAHPNLEKKHNNKPSSILGCNPLLHGLLEQDSSQNKNYPVSVLPETNLQVCEKTQQVNVSPSTYSDVSRIPELLSVSEKFAFVKDYYISYKVVFDDHVMTKVIPTLSHIVLLCLKDLNECLERIKNVENIESEEKRYQEAVLAKQDYFDVIRTYGEKFFIWFNPVANKIMEIRTAKALLITFIIYIMGSLFYKAPEYEGQLHRIRLIMLSMLTTHENIHPLIFRVLQDPVACFEGNMKLLNHILTYFQSKDIVSVPVDIKLPNTLLECHEKQEFEKVVQYLKDVPGLPPKVLCQTQCANRIEDKEPDSNLIRLKEINKQNLNVSPQQSVSPTNSSHRSTKLANIAAQFVETLESERECTSKRIENKLDHILNVLSGNPELQGSDFPTLSGHVKKNDFEIRLSSVISLRNKFTDDGSTKRQTNCNSSSNVEEAKCSENLITSSGPDLVPEDSGSMLAQLFDNDQAGLNSLFASYRKSTRKHKVKLKSEPEELDNNSPETLTCSQTDGSDLFVSNCNSVRKVSIKDTFQYNVKIKSESEELDNSSPETITCDLTDSSQLDTQVEDERTAFQTHFVSVNEPESEELRAEIEISPNTERDPLGNVEDPQQSNNGSSADSELLLAQFVDDCELVDTFKEEPVVFPKSEVTDGDFDKLN